MSVLAIAIRNYIGPASGYAEQALLAVVNKCEELRLNFPDMADAVELVIAETLNVGIPLEHVEAFRAIHFRHN